MPWYQKTIRLPAFKRGFHLITHEVESAVSDIKRIRTGIAHIFIQHT
jgi:thiamine phosphate synthase YjbQ (UPF0047 family)